MSQSDDEDAEILHKLANLFSRTKESSSHLFYAYWPSPPLTFLFQHIYFLYHTPLSGVSCIRELYNLALVNG